CKDDLSSRARWKTIARKALPGNASVGRLEKTTTGSTTLSTPGVNLDGPHPGKENLWIIGIHLEMSTTTILICEKHAFPCFAAIGRPKNTSIRLWTISMSQGGNENDVRI